MAEYAPAKTGEITFPNFQRFCLLHKKDNEHNLIFK